MGKQRKTAKPKMASYERIDRKVDPLGVYDVMDATIERYKPELKAADCRIALQWRHGWKRNKDGQLVLGASRKVGESDKLYSNYDFVITINKDFWQAAEEYRRKGLMHHYVCYIALAVDQNGNQKKDARNRNMFRKRKPDVIEFGDVIAAHGCYLEDVEQLCLLAQKSKRPPQPQLPGMDEPTNEQPTPEPSANGHAAAPSLNGHAHAPEPSLNGHASSNGKPKRVRSPEYMAKRNAAKRAARTKAGAA